MDTAKRIIILNRLNSPLIAQAIFILKDDTVNEFSAVAEAERIVEDFMANPPSAGRRKYLLPALFTALTVLGVVLALIIH